MKKRKDNLADSIITLVILVLFFLTVGLFILFKPTSWSINTAIWCGLGTFFFVLFILGIVSLFIGFKKVIDSLRERIDSATGNTNNNRPLREWERQNKWLITKKENEFKKHLRRHLPQNLEIHCNVRLVDVLDRDHRDYLFSRKYNEIIMMHVDYAIVETDDTKIVMVIELDDSSHNANDRKSRDQKKNTTLQKSNIHYERVKLKEAYDPRIIRNIVEFCKRKITEK